jgi:hypothetical protein
MRVLGGWLNAVISLGSYLPGAGFGGDGDLPIRLGIELS